MITVEILHVFTDENGKYGNLVPIIIDEDGKISLEERIAFTKKNGYDETLFINNLDRREVSIYNSQQEVSFAGPPLVGAAWFLRKKLGKFFNTIYCQSKEIILTYSSDMIWIQTGIENIPRWNFKLFGTPTDIVNLSQKEVENTKHTMMWSWIYEQKGVVRARTFAKDWGIAEAEANGSGSILLSSILLRDLVVIHGKGSELFTKYIDNEHVQLGGRVVKDSTVEI
jgi:predicted PhzF superfamily epimerase YddE/YHI9